MNCQNTEGKYKGDKKWKTKNICALAIQKLL
jgi:hypothetical protein